MKLLVLVGCIAVAFASRSYNIYGGYKEGGKYVYHYEAFLNPATIPNLETQIAKLHINGTVELHIKPSDKAILQIKDINIYERLSDPKNMSGTNERLSEFSNLVGRPMLKKPVKFVYSNGLVQQVFAESDDLDWSVNLKKGIINMLQVDVLGKDRETGLKDFFSKKEATILGICQTSYSHKYFEIVDARQLRRRIGMNITKSIDFENCTNIDHDIYNNIVQGRNRDKESNPLKAIATIRFNITGTERKFKIEGVTAQGVYVLFPFSKQEEGIPTESLQRLVLLREGASDFEENYPLAFGGVSQRGKLMMQLPSFQKPEIFPAMTSEDQEKKAIFIRDAIKKFSSLIPSGTPVQGAIIVPEISTVFLKIVSNLRQCDVQTLNRVWQKCTNTNLRKWLAYSLSLCHTEACLESMRVKIQMTQDEDIFNFLQGISFAGQPTRKMVNKMEKLCAIDKISSSPELTKACLISSSNVAKGFCKVNAVCSSWIETEVRKGLQKVSMPECFYNLKDCQPMKNIDIHTTLAIAENLGRPSFMLPLEKIVFHPDLPTSVKMHAVNCYRPIIRQLPRRVQLVLTRLFRDFKYDVQIRSLALLVSMENPHPHLIQLYARQIYVEPSLNIRKLAHELFTECSRSATKYDRTIRNTCKSVLKLYKKLYLPSSLTNYRSKHITGQFKNARWNIATEMEASWIANNRSYIPRFSHERLRASVLGRKFDIFDSNAYMQGIQDYINWWIDSIKQYYKYQNPTEQFVDVQKRILKIDELTSHVPKKPEDLLFEGTFKLFDKLISAQRFTMNKASDIMEQIMNNLPAIASTFKDLKDGKTWSWTRPLMPIGAIYRVPSLAGIPLVFNMSSIVLPYARTKVQIETKPDFKTPLQLLGTSLEEIKISGIQQLSSLSEVRGTIKFFLPFIEVGAQCRKVMNISTYMEGSMEYNMMTGAYKEQLKLPKDVQEIMYFTTETFHYIKSSKEPLRRLVVEPDQLGKVHIINVTRPCEGHCRSEEWLIKSTSGKYLSVQDGQIVLKRQPLKFKVIFHGVNRRIISLYVPNQGYVVMSRKEPCMFIRQTGHGKYFIVDYENLQNTMIKSLLHMDSVPESWGTPSGEELNEMKQIKGLLMKEEIDLTGEDYIERELTDPSQQLARVTYLARTEGSKVCLTPKRELALRFTTQRQTNFTTLLKRYSHDNGTCIGKPWGFNLCWHGYYPVTIDSSLLRLLYAPVLFRVTNRQDNETKSTAVSTEMKFIKNTTSEFTYRIMTSLIGTPKTIEVNINWQKYTNKLRIRVTPSDPMLLRMKKMCYDEQFKPDNYSLRISIDDEECKMVHVKADLLAKRDLPRHQLTFRYNYTTEHMPSFWRQSIWYMDLFVVRPVLRGWSDYWYMNSTAFNNLTQWNFNATFNGTAYLQYLITSNDTSTCKFITPSETWVWEKIKLNAFVSTLPKGSRLMPIVYKLYWSQGQAYCQHRNATFITFDKKVYNYKLRRECDHILLRTCYENATKLMVLARTVGDPKASFRRIVTTLVDKYSVTFSPQRNYNLQPTVEINDKQISLENNLHVIYNDGKPRLIIAWEPQIMTLGLVHLKTGLWVGLTRSTLIRMSINQMFVGKVCGMCGNLDGEQEFEFRTPEGKLIRNIQQPRLYDPELRLYEERHFGNSWFVPASKCARGECSFNRQFMKVSNQDKYCLTRIRVPQCLSKCSPTEQEELKTPIVCVARNESSHLNRQLSSGKPITLTTATDHLVPVQLPLKCNCPCQNRYKSFKVNGDDDETSGKGVGMTRNNDGLKKEEYWYDYLNLF